MNKTPKDAIKLRHDVAEPDLTRTYGRGGGAPEKAPGNIYLVGPRGSGKTTVGRLAAARLDLQFVDADEALVQGLGQSIADYVAAHGWEAFREREHEARARIAASQGQVVATGGGVVLRADNREIMAKSGAVFYLMADPGLLFARLSRDPGAEQRPALTDLPLREEIGRTLAEREPLYMAAAGFVLQAGGTPEEIATDLVEKLDLFHMRP